MKTIAAAPKGPRCSVCGRHSQRTERLGARFPECHDCIGTIIAKANVDGLRRFRESRAARLRSLAEAVADAGGSLDA
jgi:hypothetical protein